MSDKPNPNRRAHVRCLICYPVRQAGNSAVCGMLLNGRSASADGISEGCEKCRTVLGGNPFLPCGHANPRYARY